MFAERVSSAKSVKFRPLENLYEHSIVYCLILSSKVLLAVYVCVHVLWKENINSISRSLTRPNPL